jgi:hypothetical protein
MRSHGKSREITPLPHHPQLCVIETALTNGYAGPQHVEYRVYNWRRQASGRVVRGDTLAVGDIIVMASIAYAVWRISTAFNLTSVGAIRVRSTGSLAKYYAHPEGTVSLSRTLDFGHCLAVVTKRPLPCVLQPSRGHIIADTRQNQ